MRQGPAVPFETRTNKRRQIPWDACASTDRRPPPHILREIRAIDPRIGLEWRPWGKWWTGPDRPKDAQGYGAWRITLKGRSGFVKGLQMWPPQCMDARLVWHLKETLGRRLYWERNNPLMLAGDADRVHAMKDTAAKARQDKWWNSIDHGEMRHAARKDEAAILNDGSEHRAHFPVCSPVPRGATK